MPNKNYTVRELIHNQSFRRMVQGTANADEISGWNHWIETSDGNRKVAKEAIADIAGFKFKDPENLDIEKEWNRLQKATSGKKKIKPYQNHRNNSGLSWVYRVAAVLILGALIGIGVREYWPKEYDNPQVKQITQAKTLTTGRNEQKTIKFSNGSTVILNSNSKMTYYLGLMDKQTIKVVLDGEAYFDASKNHKQRKPMFAVHTPDGIVRDIGTKFLVTVQKSSSRVVLQKGKVEVNTKNPQNRGQNITMKKGEMLLFDQADILNKKMVNPTFYTSWATGFMHFNHTTIQEFAGYVEKKFDVNVSIVDPKLNNIKIDGSIYFRSLAGLVRSVTKVAKIPAYQARDMKTVYIGNEVRRLGNQ